MVLRTVKQRNNLFPGDTLKGKQVPQVTVGIELSLHFVVSLFPVVQPALQDDCSRSLVDVFFPHSSPPEAAAALLPQPVLGFYRG